MKTLIIILALQLVGKTSQLPDQIQSKTSFTNTQFEITAFSECDQYFYIGTNQGVIKYNKTTKDITDIKMKNSKLPSNRITSIACSKNGNAYIGTPAGILMWDNYADLVITSENADIPEDHVTALFIDADDNLWIGTMNSGVVKAIGKDIKPYKSIPLMTSDNHIYSITVDNLDRIWVGYHNGGLECLANTNNTFYPPGHDIEKVNVSYAGNFLINISRKGTYYHDGTRFIRMCCDRSVRENTCSYLLDHSAKVIVCNDTSIHVFNAKSPHSFPSQQSYDSFLKTILDRENAVTPPEEKRIKKTKSKMNG